MSFGKGQNGHPENLAGLVGNIQFPIMYALGKNNLNYALFLDNVYKQRWDFTNDPWKVQMEGDKIRFYIMTGKDLPDLRKDYLELVGRPPVPPQKAFGLWVSGFGYQNWNQVENLKANLRKDNFPVDGFVLDLQWFGGIVDCGRNPTTCDHSSMGNLDWDQSNIDGNNFYFPNPAQKIAEFTKDNIGLIAIEESYINQKTSTFSQMMNAGNFLAYSRTGNQCDANNQSNPIILKNWFGVAGMVDWSDPQAAAWIHDNRRFPNLVSKGITGHWTDLGEPEKYDPNDCYDGVEVTASGVKNQHSDIHNLYNFFWNKSIYDGYFRDRNLVNRRPFIVSRSGAPGSERFGVAMWSGDIGSNLELLSTHLNAQMHMSFSGIDYYGSDIGGFRREGIPYNENHSGNLQYQDEMYTQWMANGAWFDVPIRPHTDNSFQTNKRYETAPNLVGKKEINLANLRQRYELIPYYYSLGYRAYLLGEPVIAPLVFYYQNDPSVRQMGHEKLIGKDILVSVVANHGEYKQDVYLPKGKWVNYHSNDWFNSSGESLKAFPTYIKGILRLPTWVKAGAIIPMKYVDEQTKDVFGHRKDNTTHDELIVKVYADDKPSQFTLYEDDGLTIGYNSQKKPIYQTRTTNISQNKSKNVVSVVIDQAKGNYQGAVTQRNNVVRLIVDNANATQVTLNGIKLKPYNSESAFNASDSGWYNAGQNLIVAKSGSQNIGKQKSFNFTTQTVPATASIHFVCDKGWTQTGENVYVVGNQPQIGSWDVKKAVKLDPNVYYEYISNPPPNHKNQEPNTPKWTGLIQGFLPNRTIEWKCVKKLSSGQWQLQSGGNNVITVPKSGFSGTTIGSF